MIRVKFTTFGRKFYDDADEDVQEEKLLIFISFNPPLHLSPRQPHHKGMFLLELICEQLDVSEKDYFGIKYVDNLKQRVS